VKEDLKTKTQYTKYKFTEVEKGEIAKELARSVSRKEELEDQKKAAVAEFKSGIEAEELSIKSDARKLRNGYEMRYIECRAEYDYDRKEIKWYRLDTGEFVKADRMSADDLQMELDMA